MILSLDPSSVRVGYAVATLDQRLVDIGFLKVSDKLKSAVARTDILVADCVGLVQEYKPVVVLVEIPAGRIHAGVGRGPGLSVYGFACGRIYEAIARAAPEAKVVAIAESDWTGDLPKRDRAAIVLAKWKNINLDKDRGLDAMDAAGMLLWWFSKK